MSVASQVAALDTTQSLSGLVHEVYAKQVEPYMPYLDPVAGLFKDGNNDDGMNLTGSKFVFGVDLNWTNDMQSTNGWIPDPTSTDVKRAEVVPSRLYLSRAFDNFQMLRIDQPGAFESLGDRLAKSALDSWRQGTTIHVHGSTAATLCKVGARTSSTVFTLKDAYGHAGTNPMTFIKAGMRLAILDASNAFAVLGASTILSVDPGTKTVTFATSMEALGGGATVAPDDVLVKIGSTDASSNNFIPERGYAPLGLRDHLDPDAVNASYLGLSEIANPEWAPVRRTSTDFTEVELMAFQGALAGSGGTDVTDRSHTFTTHPAVIFELAKTLLGYRSQREFGQTLQGGWKTVKIANMDVVESRQHTHDEMMAHCLADYRVLTLGGAGVEGKKYTGDGNALSRIEQFDGAKWFMYAYLQRILKRRNRSGTLRYIAVDANNVNDFSNVPRRNT